MHTGDALIMYSPSFDGLTAFRHGSRIVAVRHISLMEMTGIMPVAHIHARCAIPDCAVPHGAGHNDFSFFSCQYRHSLLSVPVYVPS